MYKSNSPIQGICKEKRVIQFVFHIFHGRKTNEIVREIDEWFRQGRQRNRKEVKLQDAERNAAYFGKFKPGYFMYIGPCSEKTWNFQKYRDNPQGKWDAKQVTNV